MPARNQTGSLIAVAVAVAVLDQFTKSVIVSALGVAAPASRVELAGDWLALEYAENRGAAFGLLADLTPLLAVAAIAIVVALVSHHRREVNPPNTQAIAVGAIAGGAVANVIDRVRLGYVVDFIAIGSWPNFNIADSAVTLGVLLLVWGWVRVGTRVGAPRLG